MTQEELKLAKIALEDTEHPNFKQRRLDALIAIKQALAQPVQESSACCHVCFKASGAILMTRMILCPTCGNKRCPRASDHRLECTDSNESGQAGSVYSAPLPVQLEERNFCPRCGKRTADPTTIHTCTPPRENT